MERLNSRRPSKPAAVPRVGGRRKRRRGATSSWPNDDNVLTRVNSVGIQRRLQSCTWNTPREPTARKAPSLGRPVTRACVSSHLAPAETRRRTDPHGVRSTGRNSQRRRKPIRNRVTSIPQQTRRICLLG
jgi:hypothetical protein